MHKSYYEDNLEYSNFLDTNDIANYEVYTSAIKKYISGDGKFLDVGCGPGAVVNYIAESGLHAAGIEVSKTSLAIAKKRKGLFKLFDGKKFPFQTSSLDVVGSINVIEHVEHVSAFLEESLRVLKPGGHLIICCPNFLSVTSSYHYRTAGIWRKVENFWLIMRKLFELLLGFNTGFEKFPPVTHAKFQPDDDATNLMNLIDIFKWGKTNNLGLVEYSGTILPSRFPSHFLGKVPVLNLFTGGVFVVLRK